MTTIVDTVAIQFFIDVDGSPLAKNMMDLLDSLVVEDDLSQPAMFTLRFHDPEFELIDGTKFKIGAAISIGANNLKGQRKKLLVGEVTALEPELTQGATILVVR